MLDRDVLIRDVTLRDGLQDERPIPTSSKLSLYEALVGAGVRDLELTSFVRADRIPALADAEQLVEATSAAAGSDVVRWGLVLNRRGAERALAAGLRHLHFVYSVSEAHNRGNAGRTVEQSQTELAQIVELAAGAGAAAGGTGAGASVEVTLATAFGCPFVGPVPMNDVIRAVRHAVAVGVQGIGLADTIGSGVPTEVGEVTAATVDIAGPVTVGAHLHDTRGLAIANALSALEAGAVRLDGSVGGLGGCPYAPGASGNVALEDLVHALEAMGVSTGIELGPLVDAALLACSLVGRSVESHIGVAGPRYVIA